MSSFELQKLINNNIKKSCYLGSTIVEYDLENAHTTAIRFILGEDVYNRLMSIQDKNERKRTVGLMRRDDPSLTNKIMELVLRWMNEFISANRITEKNFLATTPDSLLIIGKVPTITKFHDGKVVFRNKDKVEYTSLFYIENGHDKIILFDRYSRRIRIKGLGSEDDTNKFPFVDKYLRNFLCVLEDSVSCGYTQMMKKLKIHKQNYFNSSNVDIFRSITNGNMFHYVVDGEDIFSETLMNEDENCVLNVNDNYIDIIYPLIRIMI